AADSPSEIGRISRINTSIKSRNIAVRNIQEGISLLQVKENAVNDLKEMGSILKELSLTYKNNTLNEDDKKNIEYEAKSLLDNMYFTIKNTKFNGKNLFTGEKLNIQGSTYNTDIKLMDFKVSKGDSIFIGNNKSSNEAHTIKISDTEIDAILKKYNLEKANKIVFYESEMVDKHNIKTVFTSEYGYKNNADIHIVNVSNNVNKMFSINGTINDNLKVKGYLQEEDNKLIGNININDKEYNIQLETTMEDALKTSLNSIKTTIINKNDHAFRGNTSIVDIQDNSGMTYTSKEITVYEFKEIIANDKSNNKNKQIVFELPNNKKFTFDINNKDVNLYLSDEEYNTFDISDILNGSNIIEEKILNQLNNYQNYIGVKTNELEYKLNFEQNNQILEETILDKIQSIDIAKELVEKSKNEILVNTNAILLQSSLENDKNYILTLLR
ncbi:flagellin, partial [Clostridium botulinum]|uniref:flagellin N-terminal helical domain-containing protein n=1 Tax=Clostridium botulinum TaxID=1491 RepID=UPI000D0D0937